MRAVWTSVAGLAVLEVLDERVRAREHQTLLTGVRPADEVRRAPVLVTYLENLGVAIMVSDTVAVDDQAISNRCEHGSNPPVSRRTLYDALLPLFAPAARIPRAVGHLGPGRSNPRPTDARLDDDFTARISERFTGTKGLEAETMARSGTSFARAMVDCVTGEFDRRGTPMRGTLRSER
jgi:hypothetical protein